MSLRYMTQVGIHLLCIAAAMLSGGECAAGARPALHTDLTQLPQVWSDDNGRQLQMATLRGQRVVVTMAYSSCHRFCPMTIEELQHMQQRADQRGESLIFLIISYDPRNDTPNVWHRYRLRRHLDRANWHFLSAPAADTAQLARQLGFPFWVYDEHVMHESHAVVFDAQGSVQSVLDSHVARWADTL